VKVLVYALKPSGSAPKEAAVGRCPDIALTIFNHGANEFIRQSFVWTEGAKVTILDVE